MYTISINNEAFVMSGKELLKVIECAKQGLKDFTYYIPYTTEEIEEIKKHYEET